MYIYIYPYQSQLKQYTKQEDKVTTYENILNY